jgi:hypothetical protein
MDNRGEITHKLNKTSMAADKDKMWNAGRRQDLLGSFFLALSSQLCFQEKHKGRRK